MKSLILGTSSSDPEWSGGCDFAIIEMNIKLRSTIFSRKSTFVKIRAADTDLYEMYFWDYTPEFFSPYLDEDDFSDEFEKIVLSTDGIWEKPENLIIPENTFARIECPQMIIREEGVAWVVIPKHSDVYVTTFEVPYHYF